MSVMWFSLHFGFIYTYNNQYIQIVTGFQSRLKLITANFFKLAVGSTCDA